jgi:hypothetical protein
LLVCKTSARRSCSVMHHLMSKPWFSAVMERKAGREGVVISRHCYSRHSTTVTFADPTPQVRVIFVQQFFLKTVHPESGRSNSDMYLFPYRYPQSGSDLFRAVASVSLSCSLFVRSRAFLTCWKIRSPTPSHSGSVHLAQIAHLLRMLAATYRFPLHVEYSPRRSLRSGQHSERAPTAATR